MIDEKKLMEILKEWADSAPPFESDIVTDVIGIVEEQPKVGEWIPVSEGLPKENDSYLVTWEMRATNQCFTGSSRFTNGKWETMFGTCEVIAWQPKPEPWKGEPKIDWSKVEIDTPVLVRQSRCNDWAKRYFAKYENGTVFTWAYRATSWSCDSDEIKGWNYAKLATEE